MNIITKTIAGGIAAATLALAAPAAAEMEIYEDYEPSQEVVEMTLVKVDSGQFETYLEGLKSTWVAANQVQKDLGQVKDFAIYGVPYGENHFNLVLVVVFPSTEMIGPSKERYMAFLDAYGKANIDRANTTVLELYNKIRKIQATYMLRKIDLK
ncbi:hypothetical protein [Erythrobacter sp. JK5]|uniref:hypothetical protein n=1 Tax=Erythrobacter sp. JK5 TaxID=2829500 RepID=UPI001BA56FB0|nr:hypothetical protein [Erythrobacter sp. JK5]QUL36667.1 hypothetical protein KDC96_09510 [Erythrobacter sp. JK5]